MLASDQACESGLVNPAQELRLCSRNVLYSKFLDRLNRSGILGVLAKTEPAAFTVEADGQYSYDTTRVTWEFAPASDGKNFAKLMTFLGELIDKRDQSPEYENAVAELWRLLAYDEALHYLEQEVHTYRLRDVRVGPKTEEAIWHALDSFLFRRCVE